MPVLPKARPSLATAAFDWRDPLALSASLTDEELAIYESARAFAQASCCRAWSRRARTGTFDRGIMSAFGQMGLLGLTAPGEYGGGDAGHVAHGLAARAIEQGGLVVPVGDVGAVVAGDAPDLAVRLGRAEGRVAPAPRRGRRHRLLGLTEPDHGSDPSGMASRAVWDGESREWVLSGSKTWITNAPLADVLLVWARPTPTTAPSAASSSTAPQSTARSGRARRRR